MRDELFLIGGSPPLMKNWSFLITGNQTRMSTQQSPIPGLEHPFAIPLSVAWTGAIDNAECKSMLQIADRRLLNADPKRTGISETPRKNHREAGNAKTTTASLPGGSGSSRALAPPATMATYCFPFFP